MSTPIEIKTLIEQRGGCIDEIGHLPDGSGFATASFPLPKDHWLYARDYEPPPMPLRMAEGPARDRMVGWLQEAIRYGYRHSTDNGKCTELDPDALVQNITIGLIGYFTEDGSSYCVSDSFGDPDPIPPVWSGVVQD